MKKASPPRTTQPRYTENTDRVGLRRFRIYKAGVLMAGTGDEEAAHRLASVIGGCVVKS